GRADRPKEFAIEIFRIVIAKGMRRVLQQGQRMNAALVERECVNERFQGRPGRAWPPRSVHLSLDFLVREIGGADVRENLHALKIDQECYGVFDSTLAILHDVIGYALFQDLLQREIE